VGNAERGIRSAERKGAGCGGMRDRDGGMVLCRGGSEGVVRGRGKKGTNTGEYGPGGLGGGAPNNFNLKAVYPA
jgi:hypothetical protein